MLLNWSSVQAEQVAIFGAVGGVVHRSTNAASASCVLWGTHNI